METHRYTKSPGFHIKASDAPKLGAEFEAIEQALGRPPTDEDVVEWAKNPESTFHQYVYDVPDDVAAHRYRLERARYVLMALDVELPDRGATVRAIIPVDAGVGGFMSTPKALAEAPDVINRQIARARQDARQIVERYGQWARLEAFAPIRSWLEEAASIAGMPSPTKPPAPPQPPVDVR